MRAPGTTAAIAASFIAAALAVAGPGWAETLHYTATLDSAQETPPTGSDATGHATVAYDTDSKLLIWTVDYKGLSGPATMAHFHGPAAAGVPAGVVVVIPGATDDPIKGSTVLTDAQAKMLKDGLLYINIHTAKNPKGEIRGQVEPAG
jgi:hypothetical protein